MANVFDSQGADGAHTFDAQLVAGTSNDPIIPEDFPDEYAVTMMRAAPLYAIAAIRNAPINLVADLI